MLTGAGLSIAILRQQTGHYGMEQMSNEGMFDSVIPDALENQKAVW